MPKGYNKEGLPVNLGRVHTELTRINMSLAHIGKGVGVDNGKWKGGRPKCIDCGKQLVQWGAKRCIKCYGKTRIGINHHNWKGGVTSKNEKIRRSIEYRLWREAVFARDNYTCQFCNKLGGKIHAHHIKSFSQAPELRFAINNGMTLCKSCHKLTPNYGKKGYRKCL